MAQVQISRHNWNDFFSNISHQMMILLTPIVVFQKSQDIGIEFTITDYSNFVSFLFYYYCTNKKIQSKSKFQPII